MANSRKSFSLSCEGAVEIISPASGRGFPSFMEFYTGGGQLAEVFMRVSRSAFGTPIAKEGVAD